jgi:hypothetical protein
MLRLYDLDLHTIFPVGFLKARRLAFFDAFTIYFSGFLTFARIFAQHPQ